MSAEIRSEGGRDRRGCSRHLNAGELSERWRGVEEQKGKEKCGKLANCRAGGDEIVRSTRGEEGNRQHNATTWEIYLEDVRMMLI